MLLRNITGRQKFFFAFISGLDKYKKKKLLNLIRFLLFNFLSCDFQPEDTQGICSVCIEELKVSFNFKKRCLEIFANVFDNTNHHEKDQTEEDDMDFMDSMLDQSLHEEDSSLNLNDFLIPEVCLGSSALSALDISDQSKCRYCFMEFSSKEACQEHLEEHKGDDKPYKCPHEGCGSSFKARKNLKDHYLGMFMDFLTCDYVYALSW